MYCAEAEVLVADVMERVILASGSKLCTVYRTYIHVYISTIKGDSP